MFSSTALFKDIICPEISKCSLLNCIFSHQVWPSARKSPVVPQGSSFPGKKHESVTHIAMGSQDDTPQNDRPRKRRRIDNDETDESKRFVGFHGRSSTVEPSGSPSHNFLAGEMVPASRAEPSQSYNGLSTEEKIAPTKDTIRRAPNNQPRTTTNFNPEPTLKRKSIDPHQDDLSPARKVSKKSSEVRTQDYKTSEAQTSQNDIKESLNPRMIPNPPASHTIRMKLLALLHHLLTKLNDQAKLSSDPSKASIIMSSQQVTTESMNIEESIAKENPFVYQNVMKQRIMKYKNMTQEGWEMERSTQTPIPVAVPTVNSNPAPRIETGLSSKDEVAFLPRIHANLASLSAFNYMTSAPTQQEIDAAVQGVEAAHHWEVCARCTTRFQAFPGRRPEDGVSTTGGRCWFHSGRRGRLTGGGYGFHCCSQPEGTRGCRSAGTHVFKVSDPKRLAAIMPFLETPENPARLSEEAVAFDCEMGYTTLGLELIRLTAISWPTGAQLVDVLVRPLGEVLDLNSDFSGVSPEQYAKALEATLLGSAAHEPNPSGGAKALKMVESPAEARALLFKYISPTTSLIGHALENDLGAIRIIHPCIVDTVELYPHNQGLPKRNSLKMLSKMILDREIQSRADGHDSHEDARAAGDLVRAKIREIVKRWKARGYKFGGGDFPPI